MRLNTKITALSIIALVFTSCQLKGQSNNEERQRRKPPSIDQLFEDLDANEDGKLSTEEVKGPLKNDFDKIDLNEDGFLSREELEKAPKPERNGNGPRNRND